MLPNFNLVHRLGQKGSAGRSYSSKVLSLGPLAYWKLNELSGTTIFDASGGGYNGTYTSATLGQPGIGDGFTSVGFDGSATVANVFSSALQSAFNNQELSICVWGQVSAAGVWTDATIRQLAYFSADVNNAVFLQRPSTNNLLQVGYIAGGTNKSVTFTTSAPTTFFHYAITVSKSGDAVKQYYNGAQQGSTLTGLGVWAGSLASNRVQIGGVTGASNIWSGQEAHVVLFSRAISPAEVATLATVP